MTTSSPPSGNASSPRFGPFGALPQPPAALLELQRRLTELVRSGPGADIERNMKAVLQQGFQKLDLVSREEFDIQADLLAQLQTRVTALEAKLAALEASSRKP